jgi:hypothetical protein
MKRIALFTVLLFAFGLAGVFADDILKPALAVSGGATASWGYDLDSGVSGFANDEDISLALTLITSFTNTKGGDAPVYGKITVENIDFVLSSDADEAAEWDLWDVTVSACIIAGPLTVDIFGAPSLSLDKATRIEDDDEDITAADDDTDDSADAILDYEGSILSTPYSGAGVKVSYVFAPVTIGITAISQNSDATDFTTNTPVSYALGVGADVALAPLTIGVGGAYGVGSQYGTAPFIAWLTLGFDSEMIDAAAALDLDLTNPAVYDVSASVTLTPVADMTVVAAMYYDSASNLDFSVIATEPAAKGFVDNLGTTLTVYVLDVMKKMEYEVKADVSYAIDKITPTVGFVYGYEAGDTTYSYDDDADATTADASFTEVKDTLFSLTAGVSATMIPNTTLSLTWTSGDLASPNLGTDTAWASGTYGQVVLSAKVAF